jgi:hypothetical protein
MEDAAATLSAATSTQAAIVTPYTILDHQLYG